MSRRLARVPVALSLAAALVAAPAAAQSPFAIGAFENEGRSVTAELADFDGDGRTDLMVAALVGIPPDETRTIRVYLQRPGGGFPAVPDHTVPIPEWSAVYDVADVVPDSPGEEFITLRPDGVTILSLADASGRRWDVKAPGPTSAGVADDERGLEHFPIAYRDFGDEPWLLVPQIGQLTAVTASGEVKARVQTPRRANYVIIPPAGLLALETDFQIFMDVPKMSLGDVDGDGRTDIVFSTRHEIRVFLRAEDGSYPFEPSRVLPLRLVTPRDHIRGSGGVACDLKDIDGDGRLDLLVTHVKGSITDASSEVFIYMNHGGTWNLGRPDERFVPAPSLVSSALFDLDGDGRQELLQVGMSFGLLELVQLLLSRELDVEITIRGWEQGRGFAEQPRMKRKVSIPFSFDTFRPKGFIPTAEIDANGDGYRDFIASGDGDELQVWIGDADGPFAREGGRQKLPTAGVIHFGDLDGDELQDFVIFDPNNFDVPVRIGRNLGVLPGTTPRLVAPPK